MFISNFAGMKGSLQSALLGTAGAGLSKDRPAKISQS